MGDIFSLTMPYRINPGRLTRQRGSQANALLSLGVQLVVLGVGAAVFGLCSFGGLMWLAVPIFLALGAGAAFAWVRVLGNADAMANRRKDALLAMLAKAQYARTTCRLRTEYRRRRFRRTGHMSSWPAGGTLVEAGRRTGELAGRL